MGVSAKDEKCSLFFVKHFHPLWRCGAGNDYSLKDPTSQQDKLGAVLGYLSGLAFLETFFTGTIDPAGSVIDDKSLPRLCAGNFQPGDKFDRGAARELIQSILFSGKSPGRGKIQKQAENSVKWFRTQILEVESSFRELIPSFLEAAGRDGFSFSFPPLWSAGFVWEPPVKPAGSEVKTFSPANLFYEEALKNWAAASDMAFIRVDTGLPYPYASLEPLIKRLLPTDDSKAASDWLKEFVPLGKEKLAAGIVRLLSQSSGAVLWGKETDTLSKEVIGRVARSAPCPLVLCLDASEKRPGAIEEVKLLWLPEEGEKWYKMNALRLGYETPEALADLLSSCDPADCSPLRPMFPDPKVRAAVNGAEPADIWRSAFNARDEQEAIGLKARALIEEGQITLALSLLDSLPEGKKHNGGIQFLRALASSRLGDHAGVLRTADRIKDPLSGDDGWTLGLLKAQSMWLSGKLDGGREILQDMLKKETKPANRFRLICQLSMLYLNSNNAFLAREFLGEAGELALHFEAGHFERFLVNLNMGMLERVADRLDNALRHFKEASKEAEEGGYCFLEAWSHVEAGNIQRLSGKFDEALASFSKAISGAKALRLAYLEETARFDAIITEIEAGKLLQAETEITRSREARTLKASPLDVAVEQYWLARILLLRGQLVAAAEEVDKGINILAGSGNSELRISLMILKGNILHSLNDYKALSYILGKLADQESVISEEPDLAMEYAALILLSKALKIGRMSSSALASCEKLYTRASPISVASYHLAKAKVSKDEEAHSSARAAYELGKSINSVQVKADALSALQSLGRLPRLEQSEMDQIEAYIRENRIAGASAGLLSVCERKRTMERKEKTGEIDFLARAGELPHQETAAGLLAITGADALIVLCPPNPPLFWGNCCERDRKEALRFAGADGAASFPGAFVFGASGPGGTWGALISRNKAPEEKTSLFKLWISLPRPEASVKAEEGDQENASTPLDSILIGRSPSMARLKTQLAESAPFNFPVLLTGEPGTGKEVCARAIHFSSGRARKQWTPFNCANLTPTLATSQLFGHKKGSFTGADSDKEGLVEAAKDSTLFLDEIGELPLETQAQFLRFLQDGSYQPLGSTVTRNSNARVVAATNRNLEEEIGRGGFREDLYYRLKVISIEVPPLRDRKEDIAPLFDHFLQGESEKEKITKPAVEKGVYLKLISHDWPGNVRELQNYVRRLLVASHKKKAIEESMVEFMKSRAVKSAPLSLKQKMESVEKEMVLELLKKHDFNIARAAREGGLSRQAFYQRAKKLGVVKEKKTMR